MYLFFRVYNYIYLWFIVVLMLYIVLILWEFGCRHRAFRSNLLSKDRTKGFPLQSLTQNHLLTQSFLVILRLLLFNWLDS